jgi:hypothetical protein
MPLYELQRIQLVVLYVHTQVSGRDVLTALQRYGNFATECFNVGRCYVSLTWGSSVRDFGCISDVLSVLLEF